MREPLSADLVGFSDEEIARWCVAGFEARSKHALL
jgi:hypothetical protein